VGARRQGAVRNRLSSQPDGRLDLPLMQVLTSGTKIVDAVGPPGLDRVLTGNPTGNVVRLGMALVVADGRPVAGPFRALAGSTGRPRHHRWSGERVAAARTAAQSIEHVGSRADARVGDRHPDVMTGSATR
jgi:hypothetical protein